MLDSEDVLIDVRGGGLNTKDVIDDFITNLF